MKKTMIFFVIILFFSTNSVIAQMQVKDTDANILLSFNDEGSVGSITLPSAATAPLVVLYKLYTVNDSLFFNGNPLGLWKQMGNNIYYNGGNVGIGTMTPNEELHIKGTHYPEIEIESTDTHGGNLRMRSSAGSYELFVEGADLRFYDTTDRVTFKAGGNVGIGTTAPSEKLEVRVNPQNYAFIASDGTRKAGIFLSANSNAVQIGSRSNHKMQFFTNNSTPSFTILTNGFVGIGTANPSEELQIVGSNYPEIEIASTNAQGGDLRLKSSAGSYELFVEGADLRFYDTANRVTFQAGGNVGIGTTAPDEELHVVGSIKMVDGNQTAGRVLTSDANGVGSWQAAVGATKDMAKMTRDVAQSIPGTDTDTKILFDNEEFDVGDIADATTNDRFNIKKAGVYLISAKVEIVKLDNNEFVRLSVYKNGNLVHRSVNRSPATDSITETNTTVALNLEVNDYIEMFVAHNEGASQDTRPEIAAKPSMSVIQQ